MIHDSPSHIYCSAFKLPPSSSWLHQYYSVGLSQEVNVVRGLLAGWGTCFRTVLFEKRLNALACWKDIIAVSQGNGDIITLNAITGSKIAVLSEHIGLVWSLTFSSDGASLVSGSKDNTIKLWDMQSGGVVKTFQGHTAWVYSVSISVDCTTIASGSYDKKIRLWDIQTGECHGIIQQESHVDSVHFFPLDPQHLISASGGRVWECDIGGHKLASKYDGSHAAFSFDGTKFVLCNGAAVQVRSSDSGAVITEFLMENDETGHCCFSPDGKLIAIAAGYTAYVWDITSSEPCLIETIVGHAGDITSLVFSSPTSLVSASLDKSVKFWQIGASLTSPDVTGPNSIPHTSPIRSITLQAKNGIAISSDSDGIVRIWDLSTGLCKASFQTPAKGSCKRDVQLIDDRLVLVWHTTEEVHIWDVEKAELLQTVDVQGHVNELRISGDGSKFFCMGWKICAWYIKTGEVMGEVNLGKYMYPYALLTMVNSSAWVHLPDGIQGWDFGVPDSSSIKKCTEPPNRYHLDFIGGIRKERSSLPGIEDTTTGKEVFRLPSRYARPNDAQWDGQYLVAGYDSGEVLILDCNCMLAH
jgi:WD40 repeat protein